MEFPNQDSGEGVPPFPPQSEMQANTNNQPPEVRPSIRAWLAHVVVTMPTPGGQLVRR
jgi:hypothetical protein